MPIRAGDPAGPSSPLDAVQRARVWAQIERLMAVPAFASSQRRVRLLRYLVERGFSGEPERVNEYSIGVDVFEKPPSFDPRIESIVRTEVGRLRQKLREYYAGEGKADKVVIEIPLRSYQAVVTLREPEPAKPAAGVLRRNRHAILLAAALVAIVAAAVLAGRFAFRPSPIRSLVVLPFQNLSPGGADPYLADGLTEELTNEFANSKEFRVVARTSAYEYKGRGKDVRKIGKELNVDAVLEGSLSKQGNHIRVTAQLNRTADGYHLWSQSFDTWALDMLTVEREVAQAIAASVHSQGGNVATFVPPPGTKNPEALDLYLRASYEYEKLSESSLQQSLALFEQAIAKDPAYARAYVGKAMAGLDLANFTNSPRASEAVENARAALAEALKLDPNSSDAHWLLAELFAIHDWDWPRAEHEFQLALQKGDQSMAHAAYGWTLARRGRIAEAQSHCAAAENLEPLGVAPRFCQFYVYYFDRAFPQAKRVLLSVLAIHPDLAYAHESLGLLAIVQKNCAEAAGQLDLGSAKTSHGSAVLASAYECACRGEVRRADEYLRQAASMPGMKMLKVAMGYSLAGDREAAIAYLQKAGDAREDLPDVLLDPMLDAVRTDPRFIALEKNAGLDR